MVAVGHQTLLGNVGAAPTLVCKVSLSTSTILTFSDEGLAEFALSVSQGGGHATAKSNRAPSGSTLPPAYLFDFIADSGSWRRQLPSGVLNGTSNR